MVVEDEDEEEEEDKEREEVEEEEEEEDAVEDVHVDDKSYVGSSIRSLKTSIPQDGPCDVRITDIHLTTISLKIHYKERWLMNKR